MFIGDDPAVINYWNHVGDGQGQEILAFTEQGADIKDSAIVFGVSAVNIGLGELVGGHFAELENQAHRVAEAFWILEQSKEVLTRHGAVFVMGHRSLGVKVLAKALLAKCFQFRRGEYPERSAVHLE
jgi:hypothetical protein